MDPFISALQYATCSRELSTAIGALSSRAWYYTAYVRDLLLQKQHLIADSSTANAVIWFLASVPDPGIMVFRTPEIRDLIINILAPKISGGNSVYSIGIAICNIVQDYPSAELYSTPESFKAILSCFHRATSAESALWISSSINNILCSNPTANKLFNDLPVVEAFSALIFYATSDEAVRWVSNALESILHNNPEAQKMFGTPAFLEKFESMEKFAISYDATFSFQRVVDILQPTVNHIAMEKSLRDAKTFQELISAVQTAASPAALKATVDALPREIKYYTTQVRDLILQKQQFIVDSAIADSITSFLLAFGLPETVRPVLRTPEIRDLIISILAPKISAGYSVYSIGATICGITFKHTSSAELFSTPESFKAILSCFHRATTEGSALWISSSVANILALNPSINKLFNDLPVVEAFSAVIPHATSDEAVTWVSKAIEKILCSNDEAQKMFGTPAFCEKFKTMEQFATSDNGKASFNKVIDVLQPIVSRKMEKTLDDATTSQELTSALNAIIKQSDCWSTLVDLLLSKQHLIQDDASTTSTAKFIKWCFEKNEKSIQKMEIYELFQNILLPKSLNFFNSIPRVHESLALIVKNKEAQEFFSTTSFKEYLVASLPHSNESVLKLLNSLLDDNKNSQEIFGTPDFKEIICDRFAENPSASSLLDTFGTLMNECFAPVRFNSLKKLATEHNEAIPERILRQLAKSRVDGSTIFDCDIAALLECELKLDDVFVVSRFVKNIKDKNNGVAPIHQDPFKLFELDKLRQEHNDLRKLHQDLITSSSKTIDNLQKLVGDTKKQLQTSQQQNAALQCQLDVISPFVAGKLYQIDYGILNLPPPQTGVVAELRSVASQSRIFAEAEKLMKKGGTLIYDATSPVKFNFSPVKGFTLQSIDVILRSAYSFEERMDRLQGLRLNVTDKFNPAFAAFSPEQQQVLKVLFEHFLPRPPNANKKLPNLVNVFHGTKIDCLDSAIKGLVAMKSTDEGFFGFGVYTTTSIEYAAKYARGDFDPAGQSPARADGCYPVLWCVAAVGVCNPVSRADDYSKNRVDKTFGVVSDFFGSPFSKNCDCHCALVGGSQSYQAVPPQNMEYLEMVVDQENQVIPIAVLWVKP